MRQLGLAFKTWGGRRKGAGRKRQSVRRRVAHRVRSVVQASQPVHVTLRVRPEVGRLRNRIAYRALRRATLVAAKRGRCAIVQMSIQHDHVHLIVEASDREALARGMQGFEVSAAKRLNSALSRRGKVFADRYHTHVLRTPREVRNAVLYVLNNWRKHGEAKGAWPVDPYSSGFTFDGWRDRDGAYVAAASYEHLAVSAARSWLLREGWRRAGEISAYEVPTARTRSRG